MANQGDEHALRSNAASTYSAAQARIPSPQIANCILFSRIGGSLRAG